LYVIYKEKGDKIKLDRNINEDGKGKYALINLRKIPGPRIINASQLAAAIEDNPDCVEFGEVGSDNEFFVFKLKDIFAEYALRAYAHSIYKYVEVENPKNKKELIEYAREIYKLSSQSILHPNRKIPD